MTELADIALALDALLRTSEVPDYPNALNGIQVAHRGPVRRIAAAVDLSVQTVEATVEGDANLLMVHHGLFWGGLQPLVGAFRERVRLLVEHDIAVYASHLPLDAHSEHGNNILLARALGLTPTGSFARHRGEPIGVSGSDDIGTAELIERAQTFAGQHETSLRTSRVPANHRTRRWGLCTGAGASADTLHEAVAAGLDTMIVGEGPHWTAVDAPDNGIVIVYAGHYATETLGIKSVAAWAAERFQLPWFFIDASTGF